MKKIFSLCLMALVTMMFLASCLESDGVLSESYSPYAVLRSVSIGNISTKYIVKDKDGNDSIVVKTVRGEQYPFTINQKTFEAYNVDSLPVGTDITKVVTNVSCDGVAYLYVDSLQSYEMLVATDSFDYTTPLKVLIASTDGTYAREYKISMNVHTVDPNQFCWNKVGESPVTSGKAVRMLLNDNKLFLFSSDAEGAFSLYTSTMPDVVAWERKSVIGLPQSPNINSLVQYAGKFYIAADNKIYSSADGEVWDNVPCEINIKTLFAASDKDNVIWAATDDSLAMASDVTSGFTAVQPLSEKFPLYDLSTVISPLRTNLSINRFLLVGRPQQGQYSQPQIWSRLSNEKKWVNYTPSSYNTKICPSLESLVVLPYDGKLYAIGGKGTVAGEKVDALSTIYVSNDNGLTWFAADEDGPSLPAELAGVDAPFTAFADDNGNIWLAVCGENGAIWRGRLNKYDF